VLVGSTSNIRWNILQVNGGTFSSLDTLNGIVLAVNNGTTSNNAELYLSGGTTYAQLIAFGSASDTVTGFGDLIINGGSLYLGSLGITNPNPNNYQYLIALNSGLLGALGNLAITNNLQLSASNFTFQAADNNGVAKAITLNGTVTGPGGLVKSGGGTLTLNNSADSWTGSTIISNGVLALVGTTGLTNSSLIDVTAPGVLNVSGRTDDTLWLGATPVSQVLSGNGTLTGRLVVANNGTLAPGAALTNTATLTVSGSATLGGATVLNLNRTNSPNSDGLVASSITAGGSLTVVNIGTPLQAGDTFTLFSPPVSGAFSVTNLPALSPGLAWTNTLASNGRLAIVATVNPNPTQLTATVSGNVLSLAWPADHIGWRLEVQTNHLAGGISANPNDWGTVLGSTAINQTNLTINPAVPTEFYRLVYP
jgi:autotransporter-associated beta strand protein